MAWIKDGKEAASVPNPPSLNADLSVQQVVAYLTRQPYEKDLQIAPAAVSQEQYWRGDSVGYG